MQVNGQNVKLELGQSLQSFLQAQGYDITRVAVEHNGTIVPRNKFDEVQLRDEDKMEVVAFVGGG